MKRTVFPWILCVVGVLINLENAFAQISEGGTPPSFQFQTTLRSRAATIQAPVTFNVSDLIMADERQAAQGTPLAVATLIDVHYHPMNAGIWTTLPDGTTIWQLNLQAKGAIALILYYSDFYIPEGGKLFIYNADKTHLLGAYTQRTHPLGGRFATEFVAGDELTLEYVASPDGVMPRIEIEAIGYGYNHLYFQNGTVSLHAAAPCEVNINCEEGDVWQNQKKGVTYIYQRIGGRTYLCSGSLVNNTAQDLKPYILSAQHCACANDIEASPEDMEQWVFYFHHEREGCSNNSSLLTSKTITGCSKVAATTTNKESDGLLLLLNTLIPENYNVYYNGWDRRNQPAQSGVSIHHPNGDYKKISTFFSPAIHYTFKTNDGITGDTNAHWNVTFGETLNGYGITEDGSSGAPLFNENKLIVGTLTGGNSSCSYPTGLNIYGKVHYHWDKYTYSDTTRMDLWLDPVKSGVAFLAGRFYHAQMPDPSNLKAVFKDQTVLLTWDAPASGNPLKYYIYNDNIRIGETPLLTFTDQTPPFGMQTYRVSAVYENGNESNFINASVTVIEYKAPTNVSVTYTTYQQIAVLWEPPVYEQTIYWGESTAEYHITLDEDTPFYFGQTWSKAEINPLHKRTITSVKFIPIRNNTYEVYIVQGKRTYRQEVINPVAGRSNTIELSTPFVIDGSENLIVAIYVSTVSSNANEYPAVCDGGPAVQGKGNIYSYDGLNWSNLYVENNNPERFDYNINFFVSAIVSSVEKDIPVTTNYSLGQNRPFLNSASTGMRIASLPAEISIRSIRPAEFPDPTGYSVYRDNVKIATVAPVPRRYLDARPLKETTYQVSAIYDNDEGQKSEPVSFIPMDTLPIDPKEIRIYPNIFADQAELIGYEHVKRIDVYTATGLLALRIEHPESIIRTESLHPGVYFFQIYTDNAQFFKVVRGIKQR